MRLSFIKTSPSKNTTILVSTPVPRALHGAVSRALMADESVCAEQVCFREASVSARERMQMMGGEFCVNAAMSMAACFLREDRGETGAYALEASGCDAPLTVYARRVREGVYACEAPLQGPVRVEGCRVYLPGIAHEIVPSEPMTDCETRLRQWAEKEGGQAYGLIFLQGGAARPLVYVPASQTMVWENACGSGAAAAAALRAHQSQSDCELSLSMPGGMLRARAQWKNGQIARVTVCGEVRVTLEGTAWIEL